METARGKVAAELVKSSSYYIRVVLWFAKVGSSFLRGEIWLTKIFNIMIIITAEGIKQIKDHYQKTRYVKSTFWYYYYYLK